MMRFAQPLLLLLFPTISGESRHTSSRTAVPAVQFEICNAFEIE